MPITALARPPQPAAPAARRRPLAAIAGLCVAAAIVLAFAAGGPAPKPLKIAVDGDPSALAISGGRVWIAAPRTGEIAVLDAATGDPAMPPLRVGGSPARLALGTTGLWAADTAEGAVVPIEASGGSGAGGAGTASGTGTASDAAGAPALRVGRGVRVGADASDVVLAAGALWIASSADSRVYILDATGAKALPLGRAPVALAADNRRVVVADSAAGTVTAIDAQTRRPGAPIRVGGAPVDVALSGDTAWVADGGRGRVLAVDLRSGKVTREVPVGRRLVAVAPAGEHVYALADGRLLRIRDGEVRSRRDVGAEAAALAVDRKYVWVAAGNKILRFER